MKCPKCNAVMEQGDVMAGRIPFFCTNQDCDIRFDIPLKEKREIRAGLIGPENGKATPGLRGGT